MANNIDLTICAPEPSFRRFRCFAWLIFRFRTDPPSVRRCSAGLIGSAKRSGFSRFAASIEAHCAFSSKTLMLQVRFAHPPNPAPSSRFFVLFSKTHDLQVRFAHPPNCAPSSRFFVLFWSAYFPSPHRTPHRSPVSSPLAAAATLWLPCVRGAVRRRAGLRGCLLGVGGNGKGAAGPFPSLRTEPALRAASVFRSAYFPKRVHRTLFSKTHDLQVRFAHPPSPRRNLLSKGSGVPHGLFCDSAPSPIRALVFRSAYSASRNARASAAFAASIEAHCAFSSKTLMLQVRFALPPNPALPSRLFSISRRSGLRGCRHRAESTHHLTPSGCVPSGGAVAPPAPPLPPSSRCRPDRFKGSP